jgi:hypothetical protein
VVRSGELLKSIAGRIVSLEGTIITIKTSSGRTFTVHFPIDAASNFNATRAQHYEGLTVREGSMLTVHYYEADAAHTTDIPANKLGKSSLMLNLDQGAKGPLKAY